MKPFNTQLNADITQLKKLHAKKDKTEFNKMKSEIMKRHSISKATVYREMQKDVPGSYERKRRERPVTAKEIQIVRGLLEQQYKIMDIVSVMEQKTGMPYSWDRVNKIREAGELGKPDEGENIFENSEEENPQSGTLKQAQGYPKPVFEMNSELAAELIEEIINWDRIADTEHIRLCLCGVNITMKREVIKDILFIIANYACAGELTLAAVNNLHLTHIINERIRRISISGAVSINELKELAQMSRIAAEAEKNNSQPVDYMTMLLRENEAKRSAEFYRALDAGEKPYLKSEDDEEPVIENERPEEERNYWDPVTRVFGNKAAHEKSAQRRAEILSSASDAKPQDIS